MSFLHFRSAALAVALVAASALAPAEAQPVGMFLGCFQVGGHMPGAPAVNLHLGFNAPAQSVSGVGQVTQAVNPPLNIASNVTGTYTYMTVMPNNTHIQVRLSGTPPVYFPSGAGIGPAVPANLEMIMVLAKDWAAGDAQYQYRNGLGDWVKIESAPVKQITCAQPK